MQVPYATAVTLTTNRHIIQRGSIQMVIVSSKFIHVLADSDTITEEWTAIV